MILSQNNIQIYPIFYYLMCIKSPFNRMGIFYIRKVMYKSKICINSAKMIIKYDKLEIVCYISIKEKDDQYVIAI